MAVKRGKSQARRNNGPSGGLPGWAWLVLGVVLTLVVLLVVPRWLKSDGGDGFIRPRANPDAQPQVSRSDDDSVVPASASRNGDAPSAKAGASADAKADERRQYDFYTLLPGQEVAMSDAELAASARAEQERQRKLAAQQAAATTDDAAQPLPTPVTTPPATVAGAAATPAAPASPAAAAPVAADTQAHYILQAGAFGASGDAESMKARIALLGLNARVESAAISGKTVYRVRMGPYGTATELADAKRKLATGGLPAMAVKAR